MAKKKPKIKIESFGRYSKWNRGSRELPQIEEFTEVIIAAEDVEFGMVLHIIRGKGMKLDYKIKHPPFKDKSGNIEADFTGEYYVNSNDCRFYIGDCIWKPIEDKCGTWHIIVEHEELLIAERKFLVKQSRK